MKNLKNDLSVVSLIKLGLPLVGVIWIVGCAQLHHVQISDIDNRPGQVLIPFEIKVSETGVSVGEIGAIAKSTNTQAGKDAGDLAKAVQYFQMGPRTGLPVYTDKYAEKIIYNLFEKCPDGRFTGLTSIREMRKYPVISGEIVKITGYCIKGRKVSKVDNSKTGAKK